MDSSSAAVAQQNLLRHQSLLWLIAAQGAVILPLLLRLPLWLWLLWLGALVWRLRIHAGKFNYPSSISKLLLSGLCLGALIFSYRGALGVQAMVAFLVFAFVLKLLELRTRKDALVLLFIGFIAVAAQFLFVQSLWATLYAIASCLVLICAWQTLYLSRPLSLPAQFKGSSALLVQAIPLMVVMFVIIPRIGPLWRTPLFQGAAQTGFSDSLAPGDIGNLVRAKGTAFRVNFNGGQTPPVSGMYWRGLVLDSFDGRAWRLNSQWQRPRAIKPEQTSAADILHYEMMVEPHHYQWLFALAEPVKISSMSFPAGITQDGLIATRQPLSARLQYSVASMAASSLQWPELSAQQHRQLTSLPQGYNPQTLALAASWRQETSSPLALIAKALAWYQQSFYYTLQPALLGKHSVDDFLFTTKRGFCEHFASSFAVLMRAAGVPARVVVGYQGGTYNALEDYWLVTQADAHAWVEVWLNGRGWQRVDPTSAVAPQRVEQGINNALTATERELIAAGQLTAPAWLNSLRQRLDATNYLWSRWVLSYNADKQKQLLQRLLGGGDPWRIGLAFICLMSLLLALYTLLVIRPKWQRGTPLQRAVNKFARTCQRWDMHRKPNESIARFAMRLAVKQPELAASCQSLAEISERTLYAADGHSEADLISALRRFPKPAQ